MSIRLFIRVELHLFPKYRLNCIYKEIKVSTDKQKNDSLWMSGYRYLTLTK